MEKVGLLTVHDTHNYGSMLQTVSTFRALTHLNINVRLIDYKCEAIVKSESTVVLGKDRKIN